MRFTNHTGNATVVLTARGAHPLLLDDPLDCPAKLKEALPDMEWGELYGHPTVSCTDMWRIVGPMVECDIVPANKFFQQFLEAEPTARIWQGVAAHITDWSKCELGVFLTRVAKAYELVEDKTIFQVADSEWFEGDDLDQWTASTADWPAALR